jgi:hypothetical protein
MTPGFRSLLMPVLALLLLGCDSEDPKLPQQLYEAAQKANIAGNDLQARAMFKQLIAQYPESKPAQQAKGDLITIETLIQRRVDQEQREIRRRLTAIMNALIRFRAAKGEYPAALADLSPEYILSSDLETPWGHPFMYRAYVQQPIEDIPVKRGAPKQRFNTKLDGYNLVYLGKDLKPGGEGLAKDLLFQNGHEIKEAWLPPIPQPQPVR